MRDDVNRIGKRCLHRAADEIDDALLPALIRDVLHLDAGQHIEQLAHQVLRTAAGHRCHIELPRPRLGIGDELMQSIHRRGRIDHQDVIGFGDDGHRCEILEHIERRLGEQAQNNLAVPAQQHRIAIGRSLGHSVGSGQGVAAGTVINEDIAAERFTQFVADQTRQGGGTAAGRIRRDPADRFVGIILLRNVLLRNRRAGKCHQQRGSHCVRQHTP